MSDKEKSVVNSLENTSKPSESISTNIGPTVPESGEYTTASGRPVRARRKDFDRATPAACSSSSATGQTSSQSGVNGGQTGTQRKSTRQRVLAAKLRSMPSTKSFSTKGKSRRIILKRNPIKSTPSLATVIPETKVLHKGQYFKIGDIVSLEDVDGGTYFAQIRGLLSDQFCDYSCVLTWLLPTREANPTIFDPKFYILGPEEDCPRHLDACQFVSHVPADYFRPLESPFHIRSSSHQPQLGFLSLPTDPESHDVCVVPTNIDKLYGPFKDTTDLFA